MLSLSLSVVVCFFCLTDRLRLHLHRARGQLQLTSSAESSRRAFIRSSADAMDRHPYERRSGSNTNSWLQKNGWGDSNNSSSGGWWGDEAAQQGQGGGSWLQSSGWGDSQSSSSMWGPTEEEIAAAAAAKRRAAAEDEGGEDEASAMELDGASSSSSSSAAAAAASSSRSNSSSNLSSFSWLNTLNLTVDPKLKAKFKPLVAAKKGASSGTGAAAAAAAASSGASSTAATVAAPSGAPEATGGENAAPNVATGVAQQAGTAVAAGSSPSVPLLLASPAAAASAPKPAAPAPLLLFKSIRFVKAKQPADEGVNVETAAGSADAPAVSKVGSRVSLLSRVPTPGAAAAAASSKSPGSLRATPSLLAPFKKLTPGGAVPSSSATAAPAAATASSSTGAAAGSSNAGFSLARIFRVSYCIAGRKKKHYKEGYLHLFKSAVATTKGAQAASPPDASTAAATAESSSVATAAAPMSSLSASISFLKSQLYSDRGHLVDEQLGSDAIMQYDEATIRPPPKKQRAPGSGYGGMWGADLSFNNKGNKRKRGDEASSSEDEEDEGAEDQFGLSPFPPSSSAGTPANATASAATELIPNVFEQNEVVVLGRFECELEEEISKEEYEKEKRIMSEIQNTRVARGAQAQANGVSLAAAASSLRMFACFSGVKLVS